MRITRLLRDQLITPAALITVLIGLLFVAVGCEKTNLKPTTSSQAPSQVETQPKWGYSSQRGPEQWGALDLSGEPDTQWREPPGVCGADGLRVARGSDHR